MPLAAIASAVSLTRLSLHLSANVFQVFQPIGGVRARPSNLSARAVAAASAAHATRQGIAFIEGVLGGCLLGPGRGARSVAHSRPGGRPSPVRARGAWTV